jgi:hypothetical protein
MQRHPTRLTASAYPHTSHRLPPQQTQRHPRSHLLDHRPRYRPPEFEKSFNVHALKTNKDVVRLDGDPKEKAKSFTEVSDILGFIMADVQSLKDRIADREGNAQFDGLDLKTIVWEREEKELGVLVGGFCGIVDAVAVRRPFGGNGLETRNHSRIIEHKGTVCSFQNLICVL